MIWIQASTSNPINLVTAICSSNELMLFRLCHVLGLIMINLASFWGPWVFADLIFWLDYWNGSFQDLHMLKTPAHNILQGGAVCILNSLDLTLRSICLICTWIPRLVIKWAGLGNFEASCFSLWPPLRSQSFFQLVIRWSNLWSVKVNWGLSTVNVF